MDRIEKAHGKIFHVDRGFIGDLDELYALEHAVLLQLPADQGTRKARRVDRFDVHSAKQKRNAADMVLMPMCDDEHFALAIVFDQMAVIRNDVVHAQKVIFRKADPCVNDQYLIAMFKTVGVLADLAKTAQRVYHGVVFFDRCLIIFVAETLGFFRCVCSVIRIHNVSFLVIIMFSKNDCTLVHTIIA